MNKLVCLLLTMAVVYSAKSQSITYLNQFDQARLGSAPVKIEGPYRTLTLAGRSGVNTTSIHSRIILNQHQIYNPKGSITMWMASLEEISPLVVHGNMRKSNQNISFYPFLSDHPNPQNFKDATFKFVT